jgi:hypothetical protein
MAPRSSIAKKPREVREVIIRMWQEGCTLDEITARMEEMGHNDISRSAIGRFLASENEAGKALARQRLIADMLVSQFKDRPADQVAVANIDMMQTVLARFLMPQLSESSEPIEPKDAMMISIALEKMAKAAKTNQEIEAALRRAIEAEFKQKAEAAVETAAKASGLTAETVAAIKAGILGVTLAAGATDAAG